MRDYLPFIVTGLATGSVYALAAMGIVVTYTTSGVFNFAHGTVGMVAAYAFYELREQHGLPTWLSILLAVFVLGPAIGLVIDRVLLRRIQGATTATYITVSLGLLVFLQGGALAIYGPATRTIDPIFSQSTFRFLDVTIGYDEVTLMAIAAVGGLALFAFFRRTHAGLQTRAVVDDPELTSLMGTSPGRVTTLSWMLGCTFASLAGVLLAPLLGVDSVGLTLLAIQAFGAATVGRLVSLPGAYLGALAIGVGADLSKKFVVDHPTLSGFPTSFPFLVLFAVLLFSKPGRFAELTKVSQQARQRAKVVASTRFAARPLVALAAAALVLPAFTSDPRMLDITVALAFVLIFSSLSLLMGLSRQVSLCHAVFVVFGATNLSRLQDAGVPFLPALLIGALIMVPVAALLALPAIRLSGLFLAIATFGFGVLAQNLLFLTDLSFGNEGLRSVSRPDFIVDFSDDRAFYYVVLAIVLAGVCVVELIRVTRLGRILRALADSPTGVQSLGVVPTAARVLVFCVSGFLAAIAGGLVASVPGSVTPATFDYFQSLLWVTILATTGALTLGGAVLAAVLLRLVPVVFTSPTVIEYQPVLFGLAAIVLSQAPNGIATMFKVPDAEALGRSTRAKLPRSRRHAERAVVG